MDIILYNSEAQNINFYWLDKNRTFVLKKNDLQSCDNFVYHSLKSCLPGHYCISVSNKIANTSIGIRVKNNILYKKNNHIIFFKITIDPEIIIQTLGKFQFIKTKQKLISGLAKSSKELWNLYWFNLHYMSYNYPNIPSDEDKRQIKELTLIMCDNGLSCNKCKAHFNNWCKIHPLEKNYNSKEDLINWYFNLHNDVNKRNNKRLLTRAESDKLYKNSNNNDIISNYKLDIIALFNNKNLISFPNNLNNDVKKILWKKNDVFQNNWLDKL